MKQIFTSALELEPAARSAFLKGKCAEDQTLLGDLEALLASHESDQSVLAHDSFPQAATAAGKRDGRIIGRYRLLHRIGSGGMGDVYLALRADEAFNKRVAIKLVQAGVSTEDVINRFRHERQILAALDHPNIARLLDGGTTDGGIPYFVMDYVEGIPI